MNGGSEKVGPEDRVTGKGDALFWARCDWLAAFGRVGRTRSCHDSVTLRSAITIHAS